jgi:hypothetical protein
MVMSKYGFFWRNSHQLFYSKGNLQSYTKYRDILFNDVDDVLQFSSDHEITCYLGNKDWEKQVEEGRVLLDRAKASRYIQEAKTQCQVHREFFQTIHGLDVASLTNQELLGYWNGLIDNYAHTIAYFRSTQDEPSRLIVQKVAESVEPDLSRAR